MMFHFTVGFILPQLNAFPNSPCLPRMNKQLYLEFCPCQDTTLRIGVTDYLVRLSPLFCVFIFLEKSLFRIQLIQTIVTCFGRVNLNTGGRDSYLQLKARQVYTYISLECKTLGLSSEGRGVPEEQETGKVRGPYLAQQYVIMQNSCNLLVLQIVYPIPLNLNQFVKTL